LVEPSNNIISIVSFECGDFNARNTSSNVDVSAKVKAVGSRTGGGGGGGGGRGVAVQYRERYGEVGSGLNGGRSGTGGHSGTGGGSLVGIRGGSRWAPVGDVAGGNISISLSIAATMGTIAATIGVLICAARACWEVLICVKSACVCLCCLASTVYS
jgi:hypothetical protein